MNYSPPPYDHRAPYSSREEQAPIAHTGLSIRTRMLIPVILVITIMATLLGFGIQQQSQTVEKLSQVSRVHHLLEADRNLFQALLAERTMLVTSPNSANFNELLNSHRENIDETVRHVRAYALNEQANNSKANLSKLLAELSEWEQSSLRIIERLQEATTADRRRAAVESLGVSDELFHEARQSLEQLTEGQAVLSAKRTQEQIETINESHETLTLLMVVGLGVSVSLLLIVVMNTSGRIQSMVRLVNSAMASDGDLTRRMDVSGKDELAQIAITFNRFMGKVHDTVSSARVTSQSVATSTTEMTTGNNDLAVRTENQAEGLQSTATSMGEITSSVEQNAANSQRASEVACQARGTAEHGGKQVQEVIEAMHTIAESSREISDIVSVVDEIAFQTNLLALNAAVEAARAGDHGVGFAVVATEVRSLAQRSADSANDIKRLINESLERIAAGSELADRSGEALNELVAAVEQVADLISEISGTTLEQSSSIKRVNSAISEIERITQRNACLVQEAAVSTQELERQAQGLDNILASFKTN